MKETAINIYKYLLDAPESPASKDSQRATQVMRETAKQVEAKVDRDLQGIEFKRNPRKRG